MVFATLNDSNLNALELLRYLNKSNCGECGVPSCMAFAAMIIQGQKKLIECPYLEKADVDKLSSRLDVRKSPEEDPGQALGELKDQICELDFKEASKRLDIPLINGRLRVHVLGRIFEVDRLGVLHTLCHVNSWIHAPLLNYLLHGKGRSLTGEWVPFSELKGARDWARFFVHRCEKAMHRLADSDPELYLDILDIFGKQIDNGVSGSDISIRLMPFPKVPILFSYWNAEGEFESKLTIHFDRTAGENLDPQSIFYVVSGMTEMFTRFFQTHGAL